MKITVETFFTCTKHNEFVIIYFLPNECCKSWSWIFISILHTLTKQNKTKTCHRCQDVCQQSKQRIITLRFLLSYQTWETQPAVLQNFGSYHDSFVLTCSYLFFMTTTVTIAMMAIAARTHPIMMPIVVQVLSTTPQYSNDISRSAFLSSCPQ